MKAKNKPSDYQKRWNLVRVCLCMLFLDMAALFLFEIFTTDSLIPTHANAICYTLFGLFCVSDLAILGVLFLRMRKNSSNARFYDPVTGGFNRTYFDSRVPEIIRSQPSGTYALLSLDICNFKQINRASGYESGDRILAYVHRVLSEQLEDQVLLCRASDDVFNVLLKNKDEKEYAKNLHKIVNEVNTYDPTEEKPHLIGETPSFLNFKVGIVKIADAGDTLFTIRDASDNARRSAEQKNPHLSIGYSADTVLREVSKRKMMEAQIQRAFIKKEFVVYLQPKFHMASGKVTGAEALVRWADPIRGIVPPNEFIPIMEETGFIEVVDLFVFENACRMIRSWIDRGIRPIRISVNLSLAHLHNQDFIRDFVKILENYEVPPHLLELEFTETVVFKDTEVMNRAITAIHQAGMTCAMDDFGSEYSSLNLLKKVSLDVIKMDRAFFADGCDSEREKIVVSSVIQMVKNLGAVVVAEGVEHHAQLEFLAQTPCDFVQGYIVSKPIPHREFESRFMSPAEQYE